MTRVKVSGCCAALALAGVLMAGCDQQTTKSDVKDAQAEVRQEQSETQEVMEQASKAIAIKEEALRATRDEEMEKVRVQQQVTAEAATKAGELENKYQSQEEVAAYVDKRETQLKDADRRIDDLKQRADKLEGDEKAALDKQVGRIQELRTRAGDKLSELKSAGEDEWSVKGNSVDSAMNDLFAALNEAR
jgi:DNA repair exonuclease SbcCD ATPase subunit